MMLFVPVVVADVAIPHDREKLFVLFWVDTPLLASLEDRLLLVAV